MVVEKKLERRRRRELEQQQQQKQTSEVKGKPMGGPTLSTAAATGAPAQRHEQAGSEVKPSLAAHSQPMVQHPAPTSNTAYGEDRAVGENVPQQPPNYKGSNYIRIIINS